MLAMKTSLAFVWLFAGIFLQVECFTVSGSASHRWSRPRVNNVALVPQGQTKSSVTQRHMTSTNDKEPRERKKIVVSSELDMDVPIEIAYDAFQDLPRQPSWSPWLKSVEYINGDRNKSLWKMKTMGITVSWRAQNTQLERPHLIAWESTSGLKNYGRVEFEKLTATTTRMRFVMTFVPPRVVNMLIRRSGQRQEKSGGGGAGSGLQHMVEERMLQTTLVNFRDILVQQDLQKQQEEVVVVEEESTVRTN